MSAPALRLDRLLANLGYGARADVQRMVRAGRVRLDGAALADASMRIALAPDLPQRLCIDGEPLDPPPGLVLVLNKPCGVTCSHKEAGTLVQDLLPPRYRLRQPPLSTVGRLDKETSGLLIVTDDGAFLHKAISPKSHVPKRYLATLARSLRGDEAAIFASGTLMLDGEEKPLLPARLEVLSDTRAHLTLVEGRYHQARRMFAALGNHVTALHRDRIGTMDLPPELAPGAFAAIDHAAAHALIFGVQPAGR